MRKEKILTISVAAFNVEKYIEETLNSLAVPEILDDIEVLVIDDGGADRTFSIAKTFEDRYRDTFKVVHKENGGYGSTVNYGINHANGKYFKLLDGDDYFDRDELIKLISILKRIDVDVVFTQFRKSFGDKTKLAIRFPENMIGKIMDISNFNLNYATPMHSITYRTNVLRQSRTILPEHLLYSDNIYVVKPFTQVNKLMCENIIVYNYRVGMFNQSVNRASLVKHIEDSEIISLNLVRYFADSIDENIPAYNFILTNISSTCVNHVAALLKMPVCLESMEMLQKFDSDVKNISNIIYDKMMRLDRRASLILKYLRMTNYSLYWPLAFLHKYVG